MATRARLPVVRPSSIPPTTTTRALWVGLTATAVRRMKPEMEQAVEEFVLAGGGLMPLHNSLWAIPGWDHPLSDALINSNGLTQWSDANCPGEQDPSKMFPFRRTAGGVGGYHPSFERQAVVVLDGGVHPVTRDVPDYVLGDEQHFVFYDGVTPGTSPLTVCHGLSLACCCASAARRPTAPLYSPRLAGSRRC